MDGVRKACAHCSKRVYRSNDLVRSIAIRRSRLPFAVNCIWVLLHAEQGAILQIAIEEAHRRMYLRAHTRGQGKSLQKNEHAERRCLEGR